ncbi:hypothetical protein [Paraburkholderia domus]|uniref:hypothetical protein n=1 Tax=Paraburkholderia domus TaxID=2793075 RepID=UPI001F2F5590|nr:hypothetical protein [Paraburkholderia domus]
MSKLNGGLEALGTAIFVSSLGGVGALTLSPPPQPANAATASNIKVIRRFSINSSPFPFIGLTAGPGISLSIEISIVLNRRRSTNDFLRNLKKSLFEEIAVFRMDAVAQRMDCGYGDRLYGSHNGGATENRKVKLIYGPH